MIPRSCSSLHSSDWESLLFCLASRIRSPHKFLFPLIS
nr:MAG TPA: hypothetical protein [Caudoviricetes sp.]